MQEIETALTIINLICAVINVSIMIAINKMDK